MAKRSHWPRRWFPRWRRRELVATAPAGPHPLERTPVSTPGEREAALRQELAEQWWANHDEHCSGEWPHREGKTCYWPLPELLTEDDIPRDWWTGPDPPDPLLEMLTPVLTPTM